MLGVKPFENAAITIGGVELIHRIRKGQFDLGQLRISGTSTPESWNAVLAA
jgi:IS6 family transposase